MLSIFRLLWVAKDRAQDGIPETVISVIGIRVHHPILIQEIILSAPVVEAQRYKLLPVLGNPL
jgi:hypothetical protein